MHIGKELEAHQVQKARLSCDSDTPQVGSAWSDSTRVVQVNRHKTNHHKNRPYCINCVFTVVLVVPATNFFFQTVYHTTPILFL